jgi:aspartate/methionine/tyrosine aminotransferase
MNYQRMAIEKEAPEEVGLSIKYNLSESAISDQTLNSLQISIPQSTVLTYTEHRGSIKLRTIIAEASNGLTPDHVLITAGASTSLFIVMTALLSAQSHLIVTRPNYTSSLEIPRSIGCDITFIDLEFGTQFSLDMEKLAAAIRPGITKLISICSPNNPTGTTCTDADLCKLADLAREAGAYLLIDETYAPLKYSSEPGGSERDPAISSSGYLGKNVVTVSSMSKAYGVPGLRMGWLATKDPALQELFLAAKEQISISGSVLDELVAEQILSRRSELLSATITDLQRRRDCVAAWVAEESQWVEWVRPDAGAMCFIKFKKEPHGGVEAFYTRLLARYGTYVGRGTWFGAEDTYFRLGYGWPTWDHLKTGLELLSKAFRG